MPYRSPSGLVALLVALLTVATGAAAEPYRLKLPMVLNYDLNLPALVAYASGYFAEEGIEVTDFVLGSGGTLRTAMIAKEFDLGLFAFVHVPIARIGGSPWKAVMSMHDLEPFSLVVRNELRDKVKSLGDLRGLKVGFSTPGAGSWYMGSLFLKKAGLDPERDVQYISLGGDVGVIYTALKTGKVDAFPAWEPITTRVIEEGVAFPLVRIWEPEEHRKFVGEKALALVLATREDVIKNKPDLVRRMVRAHQKGLEFIRTRPTAELVELMLKNPKTAEQFKGLDRALISKMLAHVKPGFGDGCLSRAGFATEMELAVEYKLVKRAISYEEFADPSFAGACP